MVGLRPACGGGGGLTSYTISPAQQERAHAVQAARRAERAKTWSALGKRSERAICATCGKPFRRLVRKAASTECFRCRDRKAAADRRNAKRRESRALAKSDPAALLRRQQAGMTKVRCRCGAMFLRRQGSEVELCCGCAAEGLPPIPTRYPNGHPLCTG